MTKVLKRQKVGRNKNKSFQRTPLNKRELNIALFLRDIYISNKALTLEASVNARDHIGGTSPKQVTAAIARAEKRLEQLYA